MSFTQSTDYDSDDDVSEQLYNDFEEEINEEDNVKWKDMFNNARDNNFNIVFSSFDSAPNFLQRVFSQGGDEDNIALITNNKSYGDYGMKSGSSFGCCSVNKYKISYGEVWVGTHS